MTVSRLWELCTQQFAKRGFSWDFDIFTEMSKEWREEGRTWVVKGSEREVGCAERKGASHIYHLHHSGVPPINREEKSALFLRAY